MDCQKATYLQLKRGMAKRKTSLDPEVGKCSRPYLHFPPSHLHPEQGVLYTEKICIPKKLCGSQKNTVSRKHKYPEKCFLIKKHHVTLKHCQKKKTFVSQKKVAAPERCGLESEGPKFAVVFFFLWKCYCFL